MTPTGPWPAAAYDEREPDATIRPPECEKLAERETLRANSQTAKTERFT